MGATVIGDPVPATGMRVHPSGGRGMGITDLVFSAVVSNSLLRYTIPAVFDDCYRYNQNKQNAFSMVLKHGKLSH